MYVCVYIYIYIYIYTYTYIHTIAKLLSEMKHLPAPVHREHKCSVCGCGWVCVCVCVWRSNTC